MEREIVVQPGEKVPLDGVVVEGVSTLNTSALTGESLPRDVREGDEIISGCVNLTGLLTIRTTKEFGESTVSKILGPGGERQLLGSPGLRISSPSLPGSTPRRCAYSALGAGRSAAAWCGCWAWGWPPHGETGFTGP